MPLFLCRTCGAVENSALQLTAWTEIAQRKRPQCSECEHGKWHGRFPKFYEMPEGEEDLGDFTSHE